VLTDDGALAIDVPRDREGTLEPRFIAKHERRFTGFDDKILALYARGMTVREIQGFLAEMYVVEVSPDLISTVTDAVVAEVTAWQGRPLEPMYPVVFFDALRVKIRDEAVVSHTAHTHHRHLGRKQNNASHTEFLTLPTRIKEQPANPSKKVASGDSNPCPPHW
jgi:transposase-like protein